jgi:phosphoribosyl 1,2-cyclic phosphodiesterase
MLIELWGVRGSLPTPLTTGEYREKLKKVLSLAAKEDISSDAGIESFINSLPLDLSNIFGGNTTCVSVTSDSGDICILDCGTGLRPLGDKLIKEEKFIKGSDISFFITHTHWDHVQGFPFFKPAWMPGNRIHFYSPVADMQNRFEYQHDFRFFPRKLEEMGSQKDYIRIAPLQEIKIGNMTVDCIPLRHPGGSFAYRFRENDKTFIFATDAEFTGEYLESLNVENKHFFDNSEILMIDSQYSLDDSFMKFDWGHTSYTMAVNCALRWNVSKLILTHHDPSYSDSQIAANLFEAIEHRNFSNSEKPEIFTATEGMQFRL